MKPGPWLLLIGLLLFGVAEQCGEARLRDAAAAAEALADSLADERALAEREAADLFARHTALAAELNAARDSLALVRADARRTASAAHQAASDASARVRAALDSAGALHLDALEEAHRAELDAKDDEIDALETENAFLWRRVELSDSLLAVEVAINASLRLEVQQLNVAVNLYRRAGNSFWRDVQVAAIGAGIGALGWELAR